VVSGVLAGGLAVVLVGELALVVSGLVAAVDSGKLTELVSGEPAGAPVVESREARDVPGLSQAVKQRSAMKLTEAAEHLIISTSHQQVHSGWPS
jgi:hypothetical protein